MRLLLEAAPDLEVVAEAVDGVEALAAIERLDPPPVPDVIVLDNQMPGMTGLDVARAVLEHVPDQRIVLFTAFDDEAVRTAAHAAGIAAFVAKTDISTLPAVLRGVCGAGGDEPAGGWVPYGPFRTT